MPNVSDCAVCENDSDAEDERGIPGHSLCVVVSGGLTTAIAPLIFAKKAPGVGTHGGTSATVTDAFGVSHTVKFQRATMTPVNLVVELQPLVGFDESVADRIKAAILSWSAGLQIGQDLVVPSLYGIVYGADPSSVPTFSVSLLSASAQGSSTTGVLAAGWKQRYNIPANMIQILIAS